MMMIMKKRGLIKILLACFALLFFALTIFFLGNKFDKKNIQIVGELQANFDSYKYFISFEDDNYINSTVNVTNTNAFSGRNSVFLKNFSEVSPLITVPFPSSDTLDLDEVNFNFWLNQDSSYIKILFVFTIIDADQNVLYWKDTLIEKQNLNPKNWYNYDKTWKIPSEFVNASNSIQVFIWNKNEASTTVYFDDLEISLKKEIDFTKLKSILIDFEDNKFEKISSKYFKSGMYSAFAKGKDDYSENFFISFRDINTQNLNKILLSFNFLSESDDLNAVFLISVCDSAKNEVFCNEIELPKTDFEAKEWEVINAEINIPHNIIEKGSFLKIYLWNKNTNTVFIDDVYLIFKDNELNYGIKQTAFNFLEKKQFQAKQNCPPYRFYIVNYMKAYSKNEQVLSSLFNKTPQILIGKFIQGSVSQQIIKIKSPKIELLEFADDLIKLKDISFPLKNFNKLKFFADNSKVFAFDKEDKEISVYSLDRDCVKLNLETNFEYNSNNNIMAIFYADNNTISIFNDAGYVSDYFLKNDTYILNKTKKLFELKNKDAQVFKGAFFKQNFENVLVIFKEKENTKYLFFDFDPISKSWITSSFHSNLSLQFYDKLDAKSEYYLADYDNNGISELLQYSRENRFSLKIINFDYRSYKILYDIDFTGFSNKQNPKYYEINKLLVGNFFGGDKTQLIIFQDNNNNVDWLTQKTEIYSFD